MKNFRGLACVKKSGVGCQIRPLRPRFAAGGTGVLATNAFGKTRKGRVMSIEFRAEPQEVVGHPLQTFGQGFRAGNVAHWNS